MTPSRCALAFVLALCRLAGAQSIAGRVTDSAGLPIPHVRLLVRPADNSSDANLRVAITNERGEYRVPTGARGWFIVSALRIGFRPDTGRRAEVTGTATAHLDIVLSSVPLLATVDVTTRAARCLGLDDPEQSVDVHDWVHHAEDLIRARRAVEADYGYRVQVVSSHQDAKGVRRIDGTEVFVQEAGDTSRASKEEALASSPTGGSNPNGSSFWRIPEEGTLLSPTFTKRLCFADRLIPSDSGLLDIRFSQIDAGPRESTLEGTFRMTPNGMIAQILYHVTPLGGARTLPKVNPHVRVVAGSHGPDHAVRVYRSVEIDGEAFPLLALEQILPGSGERRFTYSEFVRRK